MIDFDIFEDECSLTEPGLQDRKLSNQHQSIFNCIQLSHKTSVPQIQTQKQVQAQPDICFTQIQFFSQNFSTFDSNMSNQQQLAAESQHEQAGAGLKQTSRMSCNNIASYIIKHCFKQVLSKEFRQEVEQICNQQNISYSEFVAHWKQKRQHFQKHVGVNSFLKMMKTDQSPFMQVVQCFLIIYLRFHYPLFVMKSKKERKELYIENSVKILYLMNAPNQQCRRLIMQAQNGPKN